MKEIKISPFIITIISEVEAVIQNSKTITIINNDKMISLFKQVDESNELNISIKDLEKYFGQEYQEALDFMIQNKLVSEKEKAVLQFNNIRFLTNNSIFESSLKFNLQGSDRNNIVNYFNDFKDINSSMIKDDLCILLLNPFSYRELNQFITEIKENDILIKVGFYYNNKFYISNFYKRSWYNPCPLCYFAHIEAMLRAETEIYKAMSFQTIMDIIYKKQPKFEVQDIFTNIKIIPILNSIIKETSNINEKQLNRVQFIDYNNGIITYDEALHWELCDCYE